MTARRFFLAHAKADDDDRIAALSTLARTALGPRSGGKPFEIIPGRDFFEQRFAIAGSWEAWIEEAVVGVNSLTREPNFHGFLVPSTRVGAGTGRMIQRALIVHKPCYVFRDDGRMAKIGASSCIDRQDWITGWRLSTGEFH